MVGRRRLVRVHAVGHVRRRVAHAERVQRPLAVGVVHAAGHAVHTAGEVAQAVLLLWTEEAASAAGDGGLPASRRWSQTGGDTTDDW